MNKKTTYLGYSYPKIFDNNFVRWIWKRTFCKIGWHLWDEVYSGSGHYLYCDACDVMFPPEEELDKASRLSESYYELIMEVEQKFENESRHETALRYIQRAERSSNTSDAVMEGKINE